MEEAITRRDFIIGAGCAVGLIGLGGVSVAFAGGGALLRPPGGQHEDFLGLCIKCDKCRSVCHTDCIATATVEDGFLNARTPILNFHRGCCDFCNECIEVCPTGALRAFDPYTEKIGVAVLDTSTCLAYTKAGCNQCFESCQFDALYVDEKGLPHIVEDACNGCGACVNVCPSNVYGSFGGSRMRAVEVVLGKMGA